MASTLLEESYFRSTKRIDMYVELYQYLILHHQLQLPGIGTFQIERESASINFPDRRINAPEYAVVLVPTADAPSGNFFKWLSAALSIQDREAVVMFNDFVFDLKNQLANGDQIIWDGVGQLSKGLGKEIKFLPQKRAAALEFPVSAEKVIRENASHMVRVGEDERTSAEMTDFFNQSAVKASYWWAYALIVAVIAIMFIGWHFSENGVRFTSTANSKLIDPLVSSPAYKQLP